MHTNNTHTNIVCDVHLESSLLSNAWVKSQATRVDVLISFWQSESYKPWHERMTQE